MPSFVVFSRVKIAGEVGSQELWKWRGKMISGSELEAMQMVADTDAVDGNKGDTEEYAACRESNWRTRDFVMRTAAHALDIGVDSASL